MAIHYNNADLASMRTTAQTLLSIAQTQERLLSSGWAHFSLGWTSYQRNELDLAVQHFSQGIAVRYAINARASIDCYLGLALAQQAQGHTEAALQTAMDLRKFLVGLSLFNLAPVADALDLRLAWDGETQAGSNRSRQAPTGLTMQPEAQLAADMMVLPVLAAAQASIANGTPDSLTAAWSLLQRCRGYAEGTNSRRRLIEIGALEALVHAECREDEAALSALRTSVLLAEPGGALRLIADAGPGLRPYLQQLRNRGVATAYVNRVLELYRRDDAAAPAPAPGAMIPQPSLLPLPSASPDMVEDLTMREIEVLRLLAQGLSNKEIATQLTVSPNTVKKHTVNLYQKLQVRNRQRAIRAARALGYLPQDR
jgi:LuxR family maltose regulon positive regulatory protein